MHKEELERLFKEARAALENLKANQRKPMPKATGKVTFRRAHSELIKNQEDPSELGR